MNLNYRYVLVRCMLLMSLEVAGKRRQHPDIGNGAFVLKNSDFIP